APERRMRGDVVDALAFDPQLARGAPKTLEELFSGSSRHLAREDRVKGRGCQGPSGARCLLLLVPTEERRMRLSLAYEMQRPVVDDHAVIKETLEQCVLADRMGFDTIWFVEHHFLTSFSMSPCPEVIFGALSQLTKRIRLGFGV